jgi:tetratricopeptide (TPR) repeat protein
MARDLLSFTLALVTAAAILLAVGTTLVSAQPQKPSRSLEPENQAKKYPEVQEAAELLLGPKHDVVGATKLLEGRTIYPGRPPAHVIMYDVLARLNQPDARFQLELAVKSTPGDPEAYVILGTIALQEQRFFEASMDFATAQKVLVVFTDDKRKGALERQAASGMAKVAEAREDWQEAEARLRDLLKLTPEDLDMHQRLANALFAQGKKWQAKEILEGILNGDKPFSMRQEARDLYEKVKDAKKPEAAPASDFQKAQKVLAVYKNDERKGALERQAASGIAKVAEAGEAEARLRDLLKVAPDDLKPP